VLSSGQRALARVSYMASTRAKAPPKPKTGQHVSWKLTNFTPGLTVPDDRKLCIPDAHTAQNFAGAATFRGKVSSARRPSRKKRSAAAANLEQPAVPGSLGNVHQKPLVNSATSVSLTS
jgi:hypothetical protein